MRRAHHLRKVNDDGFTGLASDEDVEFVEVAVDEACIRKAHDEVHQSGIKLSRGWQFGDLAAV